MNPPLPAKPRVLLFDVNETLLDLTPMKQRVSDLLNAPGAGELWFAMLLQHALAMTVAGQYAGFTDIGAAVLRMLARKNDVAVSEDDARELVSGMRRLPPHADAVPALRRLQASGYRLAALSNSPQDGLRAQLEQAGLADVFERQLSVESLAKFKPHGDVYRWAAAEMATATADCMLVAAHGWDVAGAKWAGLQAAFIAREGQQPFPLAPTPDVDVADLGALADALGLAR